MTGIRSDNPSLNYPNSGARARARSLGPHTLLGIFSQSGDEATALPAELARSLAERVGEWSGRQQHLAAASAFTSRRDCRLQRQGARRTVWGARTCCVCVPVPRLLLKESWPQRNSSELQLGRVAEMQRAGPPPPATRAPCSAPIELLLLHSAERQRAPSGSGSAVCPSARHGTAVVIVSVIQLPCARAQSLPVLATRASGVAWQS
jgi:hypothetical protein